jgi:hypothetical protein
VYKFKQKQFFHKFQHLLKGGQTMKRLMNYFLCIMVLTTILGCAAATTYQPSGLTGGYSEIKLQDDVWRVVFSGNGFATLESIQSYWLFRCSELTIEKGYDGFEILSQIQLVMLLPPERFFGTDKPNIHPARYVYTPPIIIQNSNANKPVVQADIRLLKKPFDVAPPKTFDAAALKAVLERFVKGELCDGNVCPHVHEYLFPKEKFDKPNT